jgi:hypothetical protein
MNNKLFKLRFKLAKGDEDKLSAIKYGDPINLVYTDDSAKTVYINHDGHVNIQTSRADTIFQLVNNKQQPSVEEVTLKDDSEFLIRCGTTGDLYLNVEPTRNSIKTTGIKDATVFVIRRQRGCGPLWRFRHQGSESGSETIASNGWGVRRLMSRWW